MTGNAGVSGRRADPVHQSPAVPSPCQMRRRPRSTSGSHGDPDRNPSTTTRPVIPGQRLFSSVGSQGFEPWNASADGFAACRDAAWRSGWPARWRGHNSTAMRRPHHHGHLRGIARSQVRVLCRPEPTHCVPCLAAAGHWVQRSHTRALAARTRQISGITRPEQRCGGWWTFVLSRRFPKGLPHRVKGTRTPPQSRSRAGAPLTRRGRALPDRRDSTKATAEEGIHSMIIRILFGHLMTHGQHQTTADVERLWSGKPEVIASIDN
jgi:hypothetical protein